MGIEDFVDPPARAIEEDRIDRHLVRAVVTRDPAEGEPIQVVIPERDDHLFYAVPHYGAPPQKGETILIAFDDRDQAWVAAREVEGEIAEETDPVATAALAAHEALTAADDDAHGAKSYTDIQIAAIEETDPVASAALALHEALTVADHDAHGAKTYVDGRITDLIGGAPELLDTLGEIAAALADDDDAIAALTAAIADKQPLSATLTALAALTTTAYGRSLLEAANAAALRTLAGLVIGTDVQAQNANLQALAGLTSAADRLPYFTGSGAAGLTTLSSFIRTLLDDSNAATARSTLGASASVDLGSIWAPESFGATGALTATANRLYFARLELPDDAAPLNGIEFRPTNATGNVKPCLFGPTGTQIHVGSAAAVAGSGFGVQQQVPFSSAQDVSGVVYIGLAFSGAAAMANLSFTKRGGTKASAYTTPGNITVPTDLGVNGPLMFAY